MSTTFENINGHLVYVKVKKRHDAVGLRDKAKETSQEGKSVVIFFEGRYHLHLAPGHDPYQIRKEIENFLNPPIKDVPARDSSGKFLSKAKATDKKKGFWESLKN